ncbi:MAG: hypothetical protein PVJ57_15430 [Phycisphaerae bacterium]|jgi:4-amino-4-deoxy-L-arabinose transferase-like glycosyltransferase
MRGGAAWGWVLVAAALGLRVGWVLYRWFHGGAGLEFPDEELHWQLARNLVDHGALVSDDGRCAARMPVYPLLLATVAWAGRWGILLARLGQALMGAATTYVAYRWTRVACGARAAVLAGVLVCCDPYSIFFCNSLLSEVPFIFFGVCLSYGVWTLGREPGRRGLIPLVAVAVLGPATLMARPSSAGWVVLLWLVLAVWSGSRRRAVTRVAIVGVAMAACMLPWGLRNRAVLGGFAWLSANGGVTLYDAQGPQADGSSNQTFLRDMPELAGLDELGRDQTLQRLAIEQMRRDPLRVLRLAGAKFLRTWNPIPNVPEYRVGVVAAISAVYTGAVVLLALAGLWRRRRNGPANGRLLVLLWLPVVYFTIVHCVYVGSVRYRVPLMTFLEIAAAVALASLLRARRAGEGGAGEHAGCNESAAKP